MRRSCSPPRSAPRDPGFPGTLYHRRTAARAALARRPPHVPRTDPRAPDRPRRADPALRDPRLRGGLPARQQDRGAGRPARRALPVPRHRHADHRPLSPMCPSTSPAPPPRCGAKTPGRRSSFTGRATPQTWKALYDRFGLDFDSSLDLTQPDELLAALPLLQRGLVLPRKPAAPSATASSPVPPRSATTRPPRWSARSSTPGSTRSPCPW